MKKKVLVIAVHPDDETLGCGGTLLKHKANGDDIYWLIMTTISQDQGYADSFIDSRAEQIKAISREYNFTKVIKLNFETTKLDEYPTGELITAISTAISEINPEIVYLPFRGDVHTDHRITFEAAYSCTKSFRYPSIEKVLMMEVVSETDFACPTPDNSFIPNVFSDVSDYFDKKLEVMSIFKSELGQHPFPRSERNIKALATYRGATSGCEYAESFMLLKEVF